MNVIQLLKLNFDKENQRFLRIIVYTEVSPTQDFQLRASMHFFSSKGMYFWRFVNYLAPSPWVSPSHSWSSHFLLLKFQIGFYFWHVWWTKISIWRYIDDSRFRVVSTERHYIVTYSTIEHTKIQNITLKHIKTK